MIYIQEGPHMFVFLTLGGGKFIFFYITQNALYLFSASLIPSPSAAECNRVGPTQSNLSLSCLRFPFPFINCKYLNQTQTLKISCWVFILLILFNSTDAEICLKKWLLSFFFFFGSLHFSWDVLSDYRIGLVRF